MGGKKFQMKYINQMSQIGQLMNLMGQISQMKVQINQID